jgi:Zn-dependent protease/predicted transcriptional regulator
LIGRGLLLGNVLGIPIRVDYSWILIALLVTASMAIGFGQDFPYLGAPALVSLGLTASMILFASVLAHELSHAVVARRNRVAIRGITLFVFGGAAEMIDEPPNAGAELRIAAAGPAMSLFLSALFFGLYRAGLGNVPLPFVALAETLAGLNLVLVAFNLVPGFPLDGGRVLRALLWGTWGTLPAATRVAAAVGSFFGGLVILMGVAWIVGYDSYIGGLWFIVIGIFLRNAAGTSYQQLLVRRALEGVHARDLMIRDVTVVPQEMSLAEAVDNLILPTGLSELPVVDHGRLVGMLQLATIRARESSTWATLTAGDVMSREVLAEAVSPDDDAVKVLATLGSEERMLPVVDGGILLGVVTRQDVLRRLQIRLELRS